MHFKKLIQIFSKILLILFLAGILTIAIPKLVVSILAKSRTYSVEYVPSAPVAIVFGAGLYRDGTPTPVLQDRVTLAAQLYLSGKVKKLLLSGDNRFVYYNEPAAMRKLALQLGVSDADIIQDFAGRSTYDTCYRASKIFGVNNAILVTQAYHLSRALYICNALGVNSVGVPADLRTYQRGPYLYWNLREIPATLAAIWDVIVVHPIPVLGSPEPINISQ
jgi:SanA protein